MLTLQSMRLQQIRSAPRLVVPLLIVVVSAAACGNKSSEVLPGAASGDERLLALGRDALENGKWEDARGYFQQLLDSFPRSQLAGDARLGVADSYFQQKGSGNLVLAIAEYRDFLTFFPNHPRADYAQYQIGYGHYRQIHPADRDQEPTLLAIEEFEKLIELYRNSRYAEEGKTLLQECYETLAESEFLKGLFYLDIRKSCRSAIPRFEGVLEKYPSFSRKDELHFRLGTAYNLCNQPDQAKAHFQQVVDGFPDSKFREQAQAELASLQAVSTPGRP
jgi:outer membrane assembly lipoprotein YfiO